MWTNLWCIFCVLVLVAMFKIFLGDYATQSDNIRIGANLPKSSGLGDNPGLNGNEGVPQRDYK